MNIDDFKADLVREGNICSVSAGTMHAEYVGPEGVAYLSGRR